jgi:hypothetical protein
VLRKKKTYLQGRKPKEREMEDKSAQIVYKREDKVPEDEIKYKCRGLTSSIGGEQGQAIQTICC